MTFREMAARLTQLTKLNEEEHKKLKDDGALNHLLWSDGKYKHKDLVTKFRQEVKDHYYWRQRRMCCYCSMELPPNARTYDAEHILDKLGFPEFMFHPENLAVACVLCNTHKSAKSVLSDDARPSSIPTKKDDYKIVHPHLDEWNHHLRFDDIGRIVPVEDSAKGVATITICVMDGINFLRLSDKFAPDSRQGAYELMCKVVGYKSPGKIKSALALMEGLAKQSPDAVAVVALLKEKVEQLQAKKTANKNQATRPAATN